MSERITPLRQRTIEDMTVRNLSPAVTGFGILAAMAAAWTAALRTAGSRGPVPGVTVLATFALLNADQAAPALDVLVAERHHLPSAQARGIDGGQHDAAGEIRDASSNRATSSALSTTGSVGFLA